MNTIKHYRCITFPVIGLIYLMACFHRVSPTVIASDLASSFEAGALMLSFIASAYFYLYSVLICFIGLGIAAWATLLLAGKSSYGVVVIAFALAGLSTGGTVPVLFSITKDIFPQKIMGTALGLINPASFVGAMLYQPVSGFIFERFEKTASGSYPYAE